MKFWLPVLLGFYTGFVYLPSVYAQHIVRDTTPWNRKNSPTWFASDYEYTLDALPTKGSLEKTPWSETYWPSRYGGIANRWNGDGQGFKYQLNTREQLKSMSAEDIARLSPAEKYDIMRGDYTYATVRAEWMRVNPENEGWEGLCHGWAAAALQFEEPKPVTLTNGHKIEVQFGSSDVKALLIYLYGVKLTSRYQSASAFMGGRCNTKDTSPVTADIIRGSNDSPKSVKIPAKYYDLMARGIRPEMDECDDLNAGSFHIALTNQLGVMRQGFVVDVSPGFEVWNQPVYAFESQIDPTMVITDISDAERAFGVVKKVIVTTYMHYVMESSTNWNPVGSSTTKRSYTYSLDLDRRGEIIGGDWLTESRPDFAWKQYNLTNLDAMDPVLATIYQKSIAVQ